MLNTNSGFRANIPGIDSSLAKAGGNVNDVLSQQQGLQAQFQNLANGQGPNPGQQMLNQATDRAIKQGTGMIASSRGLSPALAQRLSAQLAAQHTQQAAGQGAMMGAEQQLQALSGLQNNVNAQQSLTTGMYGNLLQGKTGMNAVNAGVANNNTTTSAGITSGIFGGAAQGASAAGTKYALAAAHGAMVPGDAPVKGDSPKNDIVDAKLSPGEIVIPRHITMAPNAAELAAKFVEMELLRHKHESKKNFADGGEVDLGLPDHYISDPNQGQASITSAYNQLKALNPGEPEAFLQHEANSFANPQPLAQEANLPSVSWDPRTGINITPQSPSMPPAQAAPVPEEAAVDNGPAVMPQQPQAPVSKGFGGGYGQDAVNKHLQAREGIYKNAEQQQENSNYKYNQAEWNNDVERQNLIEQQKAQKIDPHRLWSNLSSGQKALSALGLVLGGIGSGLTHQPNAALQIMDNQIDNDIKSQEKNLDTTNGLLKMNMEKYRDIRMAREATRMQLRDSLGLKLEEAENNSKDPMVVQRATLLKNQMALQNQQTSMQLKMFQQMSGSGGLANKSASPEDNIRRLSVMGMLPKEDKQQANKELSEYHENQKLRSDVEQAAQLLDSKFLAGRLTPASRDSAINTFAGIVAKKSSGRFNMEEAKNQMSAMFPAPGDLQSTKQEKALHRRQFFDSYDNYPTLTEFGLIPNQPAQGQPGKFVPKTFKAKK